MNGENKMSAIFENEVGNGTATVNEYIDSQGTDLCVEREDIRFYNVAPDRLRIEVTVSNMGYAASGPAIMQLQFAAFGAFVPWTPLQILQVPPIGASESRLVKTEAMIRSDGTLAAIDGGQKNEDPNLPAAVRRNLLLRTLLRDDKFKSMTTSERIALVGGTGWNLQNARGEAANQGKDMQMPPVDLHQGRSVHWIGNINVLIGNVDVERHVARAFRIYPGRANRSVFFLGDKAGESYSFGMKGSGEAWPTKLIRIGCSQNYLGFGQFAGGLDCPGKQIQPGDWLRLDPVGLIGVEICPPEDATEGGLDIEVCRKSDNRKAVVEFDFAETAAGPGCYTVQGS